MCGASGRLFQAERVEGVAQGSDRKRQLCAQQRVPKRARVCHWSSSVPEASSGRNSAIPIIFHSLQMASHSVCSGLHRPGHPAGTGFPTAGPFPTDDPGSTKLSRFKEPVEGHKARTTGGVAIRHIYRGCAEQHKIWCNVCAAVSTSTQRPWVDTVPDHGKQHGHNAPPHTMLRNGSPASVCSAPRSHASKATHTVQGHRAPPEAQHQHTVC